MDRIFVSLPNKVIRYINREAERRCVSMSAIVRELALDGYRMKNNQSKKENKDND